MTREEKVDEAVDKFCKLLKEKIRRGHIGQWSVRSIDNPIRHPSWFTLQNADARVLSKGFYIELVFVEDEMDTHLCMNDLMTVLNETSDWQQQHETESQKISRLERRKKSVGRSVEYLAKELAEKKIALTEAERALEEAKR